MADFVVGLAGIIERMLVAEIMEAWKGHSLAARPTKRRVAPASARTSHHSMAPPMQCHSRVLSAPPILVPAFLVILFAQELALVEVAVKLWSYPYSFGLMPSVIAVRHP